MSPDRETSKQTLVFTDSERFLTRLIKQILWPLRGFFIRLANDPPLLTTLQEAQITVVVDEGDHVHDRLIGAENGLIVETIGKYPAGWGGSSDVWMGRLIKPSLTTQTPSLVAVKIFRIFANESGMGKTLQREVNIWKRLKHENISTFYGIVYSSYGTPGIISPWYKNGSADVYLRKHPEANPIVLIWQIVRGVEYLHENGIIHSDLKAANVMVDDEGHAKLIDFGLSRIIDSVTGTTGGATMTTIAYSARWCAPEMLLSPTGQITTAVDVYSWASTALQLLTGRLPYGPMKDRVIILAILNKIPPKIPSDFTTLIRHSCHDLDKFCRLLERCWLEPEERPCMKDIRQEMLPFTLRNMCF